MKRNTKPTRIYLLVFLVLVLLVTSTVLYNQNRKFRKTNRALIIQNDSIMSVNIELNKELLVIKSSADRD